MMSQAERNQLVADAAAGDPGEAFEAIAHHVIEVEGMLIDDVTGEVIGLAIEMAHDLSEPQRFYIDSRNAAEWVMQRMFDEDAKLKSVNDQRAVINARLDKMANERSRRLEWIHRRFDAELADFAAQDLADTNSRLKTWRCAWGEVAFRVNKGTNKITDMLAAVAWALRVEPKIVKITQSVNVTDVLPLLDDGEKADWLQRTPGGEHATVKTGMGV